MKNESLTDRAKKEIKAKINAAERYLKTAHNTVVDKVYDGAKDAYHTVADAAKKVFGWMKW